MKVEIVGDEAKAVAFARLAADLGRTGSVLTDAARLVQTEARQIVPKRTGRLASSIGIQSASMGVVVRTDLEYAQYVSYGSIHNPRPVPFLDIAAARSDPKVQASVEREVDTAIGRAGL